MSKWLIKYYPVKPAQSLTVYNLDVLDVPDYCSKYYQEMVHDELIEYKEAIGKHGFSKDGIIHYNNKSMMLINEDHIRDALKIFFQN